MAVSATAQLKNIYENLWLATEKEVERLQVQSNNRETVIATIITNLERPNASVAGVLSWFEGEGRKLAEMSEVGIAGKHKET